MTPESGPPNERFCEARPSVAATCCLPIRFAECRVVIIVGVMTDVTRILSQIESGDPSAAEQLLPLVYDELR